MVWRMPGLMTRMGGFFRRHRKRFSRVILLVGLAVVFTRLQPHMPQSTDLVLSLGPEHARVVRLELSYEQAGDEERHADYRYPNGAPREVRVAVRLPRGDHELQARVQHRDGHAAVRTRSFRTPVDGELRLDLAN